MKNASVGGGGGVNGAISHTAPGIPHLFIVQPLPFVPSVSHSALCPQCLSRCPLSTVSLTVSFVPSVSHSVFCPQWIALALLACVAAVSAAEKQATEEAKDLSQEESINHG